MGPSENMRVVKRLIEFINAIDIDAVLTCCTDDVYYRYGSSEPTIGKEALRQSALSTHLDILKGVRFEVRQTWEQEDAIVMESEVINELKDGSVVALPCSVIFRFRDDKVRDYRIFIDPAPLAARAAA
jgi:ketosteroid isomerase-like protein